MHNKTIEYLMPHTLVTGPVSEPVDLADAKLHLRVDGIDEDSLIEGYISAARMSIEAHAGLALLNQTWDLILDAWPGSVIDFNLGPVSAIQSVSIDGTDLDASSYNLAPGLHARLVRTNGATWPSPQSRAAGIVVRFVSGFGANGSDVPQNIRHAILMTVAHWSGGCLHPIESSACDRRSAPPLGARTAHPRGGRRGWRVRDVDPRRDRLGGDRRESRPGTGGCRPRGTKGHDGDHHPSPRGRQYRHAISARVEAFQYPRRAGQRRARAMAHMHLRGRWRTMTLSASWELQKAVHASLVADAAISGLVGGRVFDRPPQDAAFPFVTLGDTEVVPDGAGSGGVHQIILSVWSRAPGRRETKDIMSAVDQVLQDALLPMTGHVLVNLQLVRASVAYVAEAEALRGRIVFRAYTEPTS
eukprot:s1_g690.t1